jgi:tetratricopeptide (TPR) repeat protein
MWRFELLRPVKATAALLALISVAVAQSDLRKLYAEAQQAQASGDLATATRKYEAIVNLEPHLAEAHANLGNLYYQQHQIERATAAYHKALEQKPEMAGPHFFLGVIAFSDHDYQAALEHLKRALVEQPSNALIFAYLGYTHFARAEYREAAITLEKAAALNATDIDVLYHLSKSYAHLADWTFAELQARFPGSVYPILVRAHLAEAKEEWTEADRQYSLALEKMPENAPLQEKVLSTRAMAAGSPPPPVRAVADELVDASLTYRDAPPTGPKLKQEIDRWHSKLDSLASGKNDDRGVYLQGEAYQSLAYLTSLAVFDLDQDSYRAHQLRAQMLEDSKNDEGAIEEYREALRHKPDLQNIHFAIGTLYWKDHRLDDARPELESELKTNPHHPQALYELGDICMSTDHPLQAEKYFLEAVRLEPRMEEAHYALEKIYTESGRYDKSLAQLRAALQANPNEPTAHYRLALVYRKLGRQQDADRELALFDRKRTQVSSHSGSSTVK